MPPPAPAPPPRRPHAPGPAPSRVRTAPRAGRRSRGAGVCGGEWAGPGPRAGAPPGRPARPQGNGAALPPWGLSAPSSTAQGSSPGSAVEEAPAPGHWGPGAAASPGNSGGLALAPPGGPECRSRPFSPRAASGLPGSRDAELQARKSVPGRAFSPRSAPAVAVLSRARPEFWAPGLAHPGPPAPHVPASGLGRLPGTGGPRALVPSQGPEPQPLIR